MKKSNTDKVPDLGILSVKLPENAPPLSLNAHGMPHPNEANLHALLHADVWTGVFAFDQLAGRCVLTKGIPGQMGTPKRSSPEPLTDTHYSQVLLWFQRNGLPNASLASVIRAVELRCRDSVYHPVRDYLSNCPTGPDELLSAWLFEGLGCKPETDTQRKYLEAVGRKFLISAVARAFEPGCKADGVLVLEGKQGAGKSTALRKLFGPDYFADNLPAMSSKDAADFIRGKWLIEIGELASMNRSDIESVKAFLSRMEERFRPAYGRTEIHYPRQCVFAATTNQSEYLRDATGNRRFWPVRCGRINIEWIEVNRDALWGAALAAYFRGEPWHLDAATEALAKMEQQSRYAGDTIDDSVAAYAATRDEVVVSELALAIFGSQTIPRSDQNRLREALQRAGFHRAGRDFKGERRGQTIYIRAV
jgi:predicted P-loop ATPase